MGFTTLNIQEEVARARMCAEVRMEGDTWRQHLDECASLEAQVSDLEAMWKAARTCPHCGDVMRSGRTCGCGFLEEISCPELDRWLERHDRGPMGVMKEENCKALGWPKEDTPCT